MKRPSPLRSTGSSSALTKTSSSGGGSWAMTRAAGMATAAVSSNAAGSNAATSSASRRLRDIGVGKRSFTVALRWNW